MVNRRTVLAGFGGLVGGGGILIGTGAFTTVEAQRDVTIETAGDAAALLTLTAVDDGYVEESDGTLSISLSTDDGTGINLNAITRFAELVEITNNGTQDVQTLELTLSGDGDTAEDVADAISIVVDEEAYDQPSNLLDEADKTLNTGDSLTFGLEIDLLNNDVDLDSDDSFDLTLTILAEAEEDQ